MAINANIPMMGRGPNVLNALMQGTQAAGLQNQVMQQNKLAELFQQQGPGIMAGDQGALNAYAQMDPNAALGVRQTQQGMAISAENLKLAREAGRRAAESHTVSMDAAQAAKAVLKVEQAVAAALQAQTQEQIDAFLQQTAPELVGQVTLENRELYAARALGLKDALEMAKGPKPPAAMQTLQLRAAEAGLQPGTPEYQQFMLQGGAGKGNGVSMTMPDGTRVQVGGSGGGTDERLSVSGAGSMVDTVNSILSDPALDKATGLLEWTQAVPGTDAYRFGTKVKQLKGQAFLQAFEMLKGAGQITEIEGQKATEAVGRLDSGQRAEDYRDALTEMRDILGKAMNRPRGWIETDAGKISTMTADDLGNLDLRNLGEEERKAARERLKELISQEID